MPTSVFPWYPMIFPTIIFPSTILSYSGNIEAPLFILPKIAGFPGGTLQEKINGIWDIVYGFWMGFGAGRSWRKGDLLVKKCRMAIDIPWMCHSSSSPFLSLWNPYIKHHFYRWISHEKPHDFPHFAPTSGRRHQLLGAAAASLKAPQQPRPNVPRWWGEKFRDGKTDPPNLML